MSQQDAWGLYGRDSMCQLPSSARGVRGCPKKPRRGFDVAGGGLGKVSSEQVGNPGAM